MRDKRRNIQGKQKDCGSRAIVPGAAAPDRVRKTGFDRRGGGCRVSALIFFLFSLIAASPATGDPYATLSLVKIPSDSPVRLIDEGNREPLVAAVTASLRHLAARPPEEQVRLGEDVYTVEWLRQSLRTFLRLCRDYPDSIDLDREARRRFTLYRATGAKGDGGLLVTGYYEPIVAGRLAPEQPFLHPLYAMPGDRVKQHTRRQIESGRLLAGQELVWLADPIEAYLFHVQGSGRVQLPGGAVRRLHYAGDNGQPYTGVGSVLIREGKLTREKTTLPAIIDYLRQHPEEQERLLQENDRFVFFGWDDRPAGDGPLGSIGEPLTEGRSVALDPACFPPGGLGFLRTREPIVDGGGEIIGFRPVARFVANQDKGAAIRGPGRLDLFLGAGRRAMAAAGVMKNPGSLYIMIQKKDR